MMTHLERREAELDYTRSVCFLLDACWSREAAKRLEFLAFPPCPNGTSSDICMLCGMFCPGGQQKSVGFQGLDLDPNRQEVLPECNRKVWKAIMRVSGHDETCPFRLAMERKYKPIDRREDGR